MNKMNEIIKCSLLYLEVYLPHDAVGVEAKLFFLSLTKKKVLGLARIP